MVEKERDLLQHRLTTLEEQQACDGEQIWLGENVQDPAARSFPLQEMLHDLQMLLTRAKQEKHTFQKQLESIEMRLAMAVPDMELQEHDGIRKRAEGLVDVHDTIELRSDDDSLEGVAERDASPHGGCATPSAPARGPRCKTRVETLLQTCCHQHVKTCSLQDTHSTVLWSSPFGPTRHVKQQLTESGARCAAGLYRTPPDRSTVLGNVTAIYGTVV